MPEDWADDSRYYKNLGAFDEPPATEQVAAALVRGGFPDQLFDGATVAVNGSEIYIETRAVLEERASGAYSVRIEKV